VVGEPIIEKALEFFLLIQREVKALNKHPVDISFAGFMAFDPEEIDLVDQHAVLIGSVFADGPTMGQAKYTAKRAFARDLSEIESDWTQRLAQLPSRLLEIVHGSPDTLPM
jgi:hypothetical protein